MIKRLGALLAGFLCAPCWAEYDKHFDVIIHAKVMGMTYELENKIGMYQSLKSGFTLGPGGLIKPRTYFVGGIEYFRIDRNRYALGAGFELGMLFERNCIFMFQHFVQDEPEHLGVGYKRMIFSYSHIHGWVNAGLSIPNPHFDIPYPNKGRVANISFDLEIF